MNWAELKFGKHRGRTLPQVMFKDPDWVFWMHTTGFFQNSHVHGREADEIYRKSRVIKVPQTGDEKMVAEYIVDPRNHNFRGLDLVPVSRPPHKGYSITFRSSVIDMALVRQIANYDKSGYQRLVRDIKRYVLGNRSIRMTRSRCEAFFDDDANFALAVPAQH